MRARPVRDSSYQPKVQPLSGYVLGHIRETAWRVELEISPTSRFLSKKSYPNRASADAAAKRLNRKFET